MEHYSSITGFLAILLKDKYLIVVYEYEKLLLHMNVYHFHVQMNMLDILKLGSYVFISIRLKSVMHVILNKML